ncbi:MAG TPA: alpha/beta hydrolase, partial [Candidatus Wallbacteria bacterium]|nr:alpha/beta hydrolase [Candidatus Wallbacteria bacterium]
MLNKKIVIALIFSTFFVTAGYSQTRPAHAAEKSVDPHAAYVQFHFQDREMDFVFGPMILAAALNHGCEIGEAFYAASKIKEGDAASWQAEWLKMAALVENRGETSLAGEHTASARDQLQRASYYYRAALISMRPDDPRFKKTALKMRELLKKAGKLFQPELEYIEIPFEGNVLPGYFRKAASDKVPRGTLIMIGGSETFAEDLYFYIASESFDHGYNFITVDLPGQGLLPFDGKYFHPEMDVPVKAVVDYALSRPDVDPERLAVYGYSTGGFIAPRAAMNDKRIKAVAASHSVVDGYAEVANMPKITLEASKSWSSFKLGCYQAMAWRYGLKIDDIAGLLKANEGFGYDPSKVTQPALILVAAGEYQSPEVRRQTKLSIDNLPNPKKRLVITPNE